MLLRTARGNACAPAEGCFFADPGYDGTREKDPMKEKFAAVSYVERADGKILCVWNKRYGCWTMPGGLVEDGERNEDAQARELREETGLETVSRDIIHIAKAEVHIGSASKDRGNVIFVYRVIADGEPRECEEGCPVTWLTREEFLKWTAFAVIYEPMFKRIPSCAPPIVTRAELNHHQKAR